MTRPQDILLYIRRRDHLLIILAPSQYDRGSVGAQRLRKKSQPAFLLAKESGLANTGTVKFGQFR